MIVLFRLGDMPVSPVVAVRRGVRDMGIPADAMTIGCLRTRRSLVRPATPLGRRPAFSGQ